MQIELEKIFRLILLLPDEEKRQFFTETAPEQSIESDTDDGFKNDEQPIEQPASPQTKPNYYTTE